MEIANRQGFLATFDWRSPEMLGRLGLLLFLEVVFIYTAYLGFLLFRFNDTWLLGDWLINYEGGFVRRGVTGEIFLLLSGLTDLPPMLFVVFAQLACYLVYLYFAWRLLDRQDRLLPFLLLIVSPFIFLFQVYGPGGGFRKEVLFFALLAWLAFASINRSRESFDRVFIAAMLGYPLLILSHEMLAIYMPWIVALYVRDRPFSWPLVRRLGLLIAPSVVAFALAMRFPGSAETVAAICDSLGRYAFDRCVDAGPIAWLQVDTAFGIGKVSQKIANHYLPVYAAATLFALIAYVPLASRLRRMWQNRLMMLLIASSVLGSLALFVVAIDWGRFIYIHLVALFLVLLTIEPAEGESATGPLSLLSRQPVLRWALIVLVAGVYATQWRLLHFY